MLNILNRILMKYDKLYTSIDNQEEYVNELEFHQRLISIVVVLF